MKKGKLFLGMLLTTSVLLGGCSSEKHQVCTFDKEKDVKLDLITKKDNIKEAKLTVTQQISGLLEIDHDTYEKMIKKSDAKEKQQINENVTKSFENIGFEEEFEENFAESADGEVSKDKVKKAISTKVKSDVDKDEVKLIVKIDFVKMEETIDWKVVVKNLEKSYGKSTCKEAK